MRAGIRMFEVDEVVAKLKAGKPWGEATKVLAGVEPEVIEANKADLMKRAGIEVPVEKPVEPAPAPKPAEPVKTVKSKHDPLA